MSKYINKYNYKYADDKLNMVEISLIIVIILYYIYYMFRIFNI